VYECVCVCEQRALEKCKLDAEVRLCVCEIVSVVMDSVCVRVYACVGVWVWVYV
jgi:Ethanolamine utilization protein EutJ (predicted chaperonin)